MKTYRTRYPHGRVVVRDSIFGVDTDPFHDCVRDYAHNLAAGTGVLRGGHKRAYELTEIDLFAEMIAPELEKRRRKKTKGLPVKETPDQFRELLREHIDKAAARKVPAPPIEPARTGLAVMARLGGLNDLERDILQFLVVLQHSRALLDLVNLFGEITLSEAALILSVALVKPRRDVLHTLSAKGRLVASGLVVADSDVEHLHLKLRPKAHLVDLICAPGLDRDKVLARFLPVAEAPSLGRPDFEHLAEALETSQKLLGAALGRRRRGVNILFYGTTGTGKTELARLLARELGVKLYKVGQADAEGDSASASERLSSLRLANQLVGKHRAILLFDELEDLFDWRRHGLLGEKHGTAEMSKQWFNDVLEQNASPTIWITNEAQGIDPAYLRRFSFAVEFRPLGAPGRERVLRRHLGRTSKLSPDEVHAVAEKFTVSPAQLGSAVKVARLLEANRRPTRAALERILAPVQKLVTGVDARRWASFDPKAFRIDILNSSADLAEVATRLKTWKPGAGPGISLCLYGPPGTGKSEYVRYLAHTMGRPVVYRRSSDLESCWVGETEKNIARAFHEAEEDDAVLLFDEVDSFLWDRAAAQRSWEVTRTNEFLQQLEAFRGVVACTTNQWRDLDEASLRRFVFKVELRYLQADQAFELLRSTLGVTPDPAEREQLGALANLAPGDFAAVNRRLRALGSQPNVREYVNLLVSECQAKRTAARSIGF